MSKSCKHERFLASAAVARLTDVEGGPVTGYSVSIAIKCEQCNLPFRFRGDRFGSSPHEPRLSADGLELRAPLEPAHVQEFLGMPITRGSA